MDARVFQSSSSLSRIGCRLDTSDGVIVFTSRSCRK